MEYFIRFCIILFFGLFCATLGPFTFMGPLFGFPIITLVSLISMFFIDGSRNYIKQSFILFLLNAVIFVLLFVGGSGLSMLAIGMAFQGAGILIWCFFTPFLVKSLKGTK